MEILSLITWEHLVQVCSKVVTSLLILSCSSISSIVIFALLNNESGAQFLSLHWEQPTKFWMYTPESAHNVSLWGKQVLTQFLHIFYHFFTETQLKYASKIFDHEFLYYAFIFNFHITINFKFGYLSFSSFECLCSPYII